MLIIDSYSSYINLKFIQFCEEYKIILIYLLFYLIYLLQPFNLIIFLQLKYLYLLKVNEYTVHSVTKINKEYFFKDIKGDLPLYIYTKTN
jgi:hypothetical protein